MGLDHEGEGKVVQDVRKIYTKILPGFVRLQPEHTGMSKTGSQILAVTYDCGGIGW